MRGPAAAPARFWRPGAERPGCAEDRPDGDPLQTTTFVYNAHAALSLQQQRQRLPIFALRNHVLAALQRHQTLLLLGDTGCGKSTQVPQYVHEAGWTAAGRLVGVTQPRRVAATALAGRVAEETGSMLGHTVGYSIRFDECFDPVHTRIKYMTEAILIREMMADPLLRNYAVIMLDEVHERSINTDIVMGLMKKILKRRADLRLIVSSATVDAEPLRRFFTLDKDAQTATVLSVRGRQFPVDVFYSNDPVPDYVRGCADVAARIHRSEPPGDVLVFVTGQQEVDEVVSALSALPTAPGADKLLALPMHGALSSGEQLRAFQRAPPGCRKVVVATNIAEASVTIPGVVYVVDCGLVKQRWHRPDWQADALLVCAASRAAAEQRAGRAGRLRPGKVYRLYPQREWSALPAYSVPEVSRSDLSGALLLLLALGVRNVARFALPTPPPARAVLAAVQQLYALGAVDERAQLTEAGRQMAELPVAPPLARMLLAGGQFGCAEEMATLVAMLQVSDVLERPRGGQQLLRARAAHRSFQVEQGDMLTYLNIYQAFEQHQRSGQWCQRMFVRRRALLRVDEIRRHVLRALQRLGVATAATGRVDGDGAAAVRRCIAAGLFMNSARRDAAGEYRSVRGGRRLLLHGDSVLHAAAAAGAAPPPGWLVFGELVHTADTSLPCMRHVTAIEPHWLTELAPHFYHVAAVAPLMCDGADADV